MKFYALGGLIYEIKADNVGTSTDIVLELYDSDGITKLITADDSTVGQSEELITWTAQKTGIYYVRVKNYDPNVYGKRTNYDLKVYRPTAPDIGTVRGIIISDSDIGSYYQCYHTSRLGVCPQ